MFCLYNRTQYSKENKWTIAIQNVFESKIHNGEPQKVGHQIVLLIKIENR